MEESVHVFISYADTWSDSYLCDKLEKHLTPLKKEGLVSLWSRHNIKAGTEWMREVNVHLDTAHIILLLVSADFLSSDYCYSIEMKRAIDRHSRGEARVIPIILRPVDW
jgi:TIR domain